jgi:hypothetical protein
MTHTEGAKDTDGRAVGFADKAEEEMLCVDEVR